jgi:restriction system protein
MGKRRGLLEDLIDLSSKLPWWAGVALAIAAYFLLHSVATSSAPAIGSPGDMGKQVAGHLLRALATISQYLLPLAFLIGAAVSAFRQRKRRTLFEQTARGGPASAVNGLSWQEFELLIGEAFRRRGYRVEETGSTGGDGGIDLVLAKGHERFFVQCKHWRAVKVSVITVRELYGVMAAQGAAGGFVVTSGQFTKDAKAFASGRNIELIDGTKLPAMLRRARVDTASASPATGAIKVLKPAPPSLPSRAVSAAPECPVCGSEMVKRIAKRGSRAGQDFWGCTRYPGCRGTRQLG